MTQPPLRLESVSCRGGDERCVVRAAFSRPLTDKEFSDFMALCDAFANHPLSRMVALDEELGLYDEPASAIEARSDATPKSDAAEGESATRQGDAQ